jgi:hypothetical protein
MFSRKLNVRWGSTELNQKNKIKFTPGKQFTITETAGSVSG